MAAGHHDGDGSRQPPPVGTLDIFAFDSPPPPLSIPASPVSSAAAGSLPSSPLPSSPNPDLLTGANHDSLVDDMRGYPPPQRRWRLYCFRRVFVIEPNVSGCGLRYQASELSNLVRVDHPFQIKWDTAKEAHRGLPQLLIFRDSGDVVEVPNAAHQLYKTFGSLQKLFLIDSLIGIVPVADARFLAVVADSEAVAGFSRSALSGGSVPTQSDLGSAARWGTGVSAFDAYIYRVRRAWLVPFHLSLEHLQSHSNLSIEGNEGNNPPELRRLGASIPDVSRRYSEAPQLKGSSWPITLEESSSNHLSANTIPMVRERQDSISSTSSASLQQNVVPVMHCRWETIGFGDAAFTSYLGERLASYKLGVERLLSSGVFYYSYDIDMTHSLQRKADLDLILLAQGWPCTPVTTSETTGNPEQQPQPRIKEAALLEVADTRFLWNAEAAAPLLAAGADPRWVAPVIQGSVNSVTMAVGIHGLDLVLLSRRSCCRPGTRYIHRGLDDSGAVANFNESELVVSPIRVAPRGAVVINRSSEVAGGGAASYLQIRGSVPLFWTQQPAGLNINPAPQLSRELGLTWQAFASHQAELRRVYGEITYVDLLALSGKAGEQRIGSSLGRMLRAFNDVHEQQAFDEADAAGDSRRPAKQVIPSTRHFRWDFHSQVKQKGFETAMAEFANALANDARRFGYYAVGTGFAAKRQVGVFRTNCLDCLDRTNGAQWYLCWTWLCQYLHQRGLRSLLVQGYKIAEQPVPGENEASATAAWLEQGRSVVTRSFGGVCHMATAFRCAGSIPLDGTVGVLKEAVAVMWAELGDDVSRAYTGTSSVLSSLLRQGKASLSTNMNHVMTSLGRIYQNTFEDPQRQDAIDLFLVRHPHLSKSTVKPAAAKAEDSSMPWPPKGDQTVNHLNLKVWFGTWNLGGNKQVEPLERWLFQPVETEEKGKTAVPEVCDLYAIAIQELVELTGLRVLMSSSDREKEARLQLHLTHALGPDFTLLCSHSLVGLYLTVFIRNQLATTVTQVQTTELKLGFKGQMGNKGALLIRFLVGATSVCLGNLHLVPGASKSVQREQQLLQVLDARFPGRSQYAVRHHDVVVIGGDFNFRCCGDQSQNSVLVHFGMWHELLFSDQFLVGQRQRVPVFRELREAPITFLPTYKFRKGTPLYDRSRTPSWCDRIFHAGKSSTKNWLICTRYARIDEFLSSDHRPVYAEFTVRVLVPSTQLHPELQDRIIDPEVENTECTEVSPPPHSPQEMPPMRSNVEEQKMSVAEWDSQAPDLLSVHSSSSDLDEDVPEGLDNTADQFLPPDEKAEEDFKSLPDFTWLDKETSRNNV